MRQKSHSTDLSSEEIVKGIRRATRKRYSAEDKIRIVLDVVTIGVDPGKNTFHLIGLDARGGIVLREKVSARPDCGPLANVPPWNARISLAFAQHGHCRPTSSPAN